MAIETDTWYFPFDAVDSEAGKIAMKEEETKRFVFVCFGLV